jgi:hypothetical protein
MFLPRKNDCVVASHDRLILDSVGEPEPFAGDDLEGQLAFRANGDPRRESRETDLEPSANRKGDMDCETGPVWR